MGSKTTDRDMGAKAIVKELAEAANHVVSVGVNENAGSYPSGERIVDVAFWNEYGTVRIPERSFIRSTIDENLSRLNTERKRLMNEVLEGKRTAMNALAALGFMIQEMIRAKIENFGEPKNALGTVARKPHIGNKPLVNTRTLKRAISYVISKRSS